MTHGITASFFRVRLPLSLIAFSMVTAVRNIGGMRQANEQIVTDANEAKTEVAEDRARSREQAAACKPNTPGVGRDRGFRVRAPRSKKKSSTRCGKGQQGMHRRERMGLSSSMWQNREILSVKLSSPAQDRDELPGTVRCRDRPATDPPAPQRSGLPHGRQRLGAHSYVRRARLP